MKTVGFFGGSFNPVHCGHIALAEAIVRMGLVDEVWLSLSPLNPFKEARAEELVEDSQRLRMLQLAAEGAQGVRVTDVELSMPRPSYTIDTLRRLAQEHPDCRFRFIIGADNVAGLPRWKEGGALVQDFPPIIYPRPGYEAEGEIEGLPTFDVSSTEVRSRIAAGESVNKLLPPAVLEYIAANHLYGYKC